MRLERLEDRRILDGVPLISELMAVNSSTLADEDGDFSDWIEIHNPTAAPIALEGWHLTDDAGALDKWSLPSVTLDAGGYLVVFASGKDRAGARGELHTNFSLSSSGEYLALVEPDGVTVAHAYAPEFPLQKSNISFGIDEANEETLRYFHTATPGGENSMAASFAGFVADVEMSVEHGFFDAPFELELSTATEGASIRYTTDGREPSARVGFIYNGPITISSTTIIRATASKSDFSSPPLKNSTYLFLDDVVQQSSNPAQFPTFGWPQPGQVNGQQIDYGMDPDVVNNPLYRDTIKDDLKAIPSMAIVMDLNDLFNPTRGIYVNASQEGRGTEREASLELINPDGSQGFQIDAGIRIRGGFSRSGDNPKHAFRFFFREEYGASKLEFPLFGDEGVNAFDNIDLRTSQNYSWAFQGDSRNTMNRDVFSRDTQRDMGQPYTRSRYYHLYINGVYWGLFQSQERAEAAFAESYFGGDKDEYDVVKAEAGPYTTVATDGNLDAYLRMWNVITNQIPQASAAAKQALYHQLQGNNPDGTRNPEFEVLLDAENLIDYMMVIYYGGNLDAPISNFLGNDRVNNWFGIRNRNGEEGFKYFAHDSEHTMLNINENRTGPYIAGTNAAHANPQWFFQQLWQVEDFRMLIADRVHKHFFNDGVLTPEAATERFMARANEIDRAIVAESARWGDAKRGTPFTRNAEWVSAINTIVNGYFPQRSNIVLSQLQSKQLVGRAPAPAFNQHGGSVRPGFQLTITQPSSSVYYSLDGSDPRLPGGEINPDAILYDGAEITLSSSVLVKARTRDVRGNWSAVNEATFLVTGTPPLRITEMMYHPQDPAPGGPFNDDDFEFIEFMNTGDEPLQLAGYQLSDGVSFTFPNMELAPEDRVVVVANRAAFESRYGGAMRIAGEYDGQLSNGGERVVLESPFAEVIHDFVYSDAWQPSTDGPGRSLVVVDPVGDPTLLGEPDSWTASRAVGGSPGAPEPIVQPLPGDANGDGVVDLEDLNAVRNNFGGMGQGDTNGDGVVDLEDLNAVRNNFGAQAAAAPLAIAPPAPQAAPTPVRELLLAGGLVAAAPALPPETAERLANSVITATSATSTSPTRAEVARPVRRFVDPGLLTPATLVTRPASELRQREAPVRRVAEGGSPVAAPTATRARFAQQLARLDRSSRGHQTAREANDAEWDAALAELVIDFTS